MEAAFVAACGLGKDGHKWTCAACGRGRPRGAAAASRRRGPRPRRRAPPPVIRACARRRSASGRARGRRGSCLLSERGLPRVSSTAVMRLPALGASWLPLGTGASVEGATRRGRLEGALAALSRVAVRAGPDWASPFRTLSQTRCGTPARHSKRRGAADVSKRRFPPTSPRAPQQQMRPTTASQHGRGSRARRVDSLMITKRAT